MKLQRSPVIFHLQPASLLSLSPPLFCAAATRGPAGRPPPACAGRPCVAPDLLHRPCLSAGALLSLPRAPETTAGRHIFVAVASSDRVPAALSFARIRTRRISSTYSPHYRAVSSTPDPETPPPLTRTPANLKLTVDPLLQGRSARADLTISSASLSRS